MWDVKKNYDVLDGLKATRQKVSTGGFRPKNGFAALDAGTQNETISRNLLRSKVRGSDIWPNALERLLIAGLWLVGVGVAAK